MSVPLPAYTRMVIIGLGYLFPISAIWAAFDYWKELFPDGNIEFIVTCIYQVGALGTVMLLSFSKSMDFDWRIVGGFTGQFLCLGVVFLFPWLPFLRSSPSVQYPVLLVLVFLMSVVTGFLDSALLALNSQYTPKMQEAMQVGIGFSTLISVIFRDITKLGSEVSDLSSESSSSIYFLLGLLTIVVCVWSYFSLMRLPVSKHIHSHIARGMVDEPLLGRVETSANTPVEAEKDDGVGLKEFSLMHTFRKSWVQQISIFGHFAITTSIYPALLTAIPVENEEAFYAKRHWFQTLQLTLFTFSDIVARYLVRFRGPLNYKNFWSTLLLRVLFFPLIVLSTLNVFRSDLFCSLLVVLAGMQNGYLNSLALIVVNEIPKMCNEEKKAVGRFSACSVNGGLCVGSLVSMGIGVALHLTDA